MILEYNEAYSPHSHSSLDILVVLVDPLWEQGYVLYDLGLESNNGHASFFEPPALVIYSKGAFGSRRKEIRIPDLPFIFKVQGGK